MTWLSSRVAVVCVGVCLVPLRAASQAECAPGIEFYEDGRFRACTLTANQRVGLPTGVWIHCRHGGTLELFPDGSLKRCTLDRPLALQGQRCDAGREIRMTPAAQMESCSGQ